MATRQLSGAPSSKLSSAEGRIAVLSRLNKFTQIALRTRVPEHASLKAHARALAPLQFSQQCVNSAGLFHSSARLWASRQRQATASAAGAAANTQAGGHQHIPLVVHQFEGGAIEAGQLPFSSSSSSASSTPFASHRAAAAVSATTRPKSLTDGLSFTTTTTTNSTGTGTSGADPRGSGAAAAASVFATPPRVLVYAKADLWPVLGQAWLELVSDKDAPGITGESSADAVGTVSTLVVGDQHAAKNERLK